MGVTLSQVASSIKLAIFFVVALAITACGGGGGGGGSNTASAVSPVVPVYSLGGSVQGLSVGDVVRISDSVEVLSLSSNGTFTFVSSVQDNSSVTVTTQPTTPGVYCSIADAVTPSSYSGFFGYAAGNATAVKVVCGVYPAIKASLPMVTTMVAGAVPVVLQNPHIVPVFYQDTQNQNTKTSFVNTLVASSLWANISQYGVGAATVGAPVVIGSNAPTTLSDANISSLLNANSLTWSGGYALKDSFFLFFVPATTSNSTASCSANTPAYHTAAVVGTIGTVVSYAFLPDCISSSVLRSAQHEIMEGVVDPSGANGYNRLTFDSHAWGLTAGNTASEIADLCESFNVTVSDIPGVTLQPIWSNQAAVAGSNPCAPNPSALYFGAVPTFPSILTDGSGAKTHGVALSPGASVTIPVKLFSTQPTTGAMTVSARKSGVVSNSSQIGDVTFSFDKTSGVNGDTLMLTITASTTAFPGMYTISIETTYQNVTYSQPGGVANSVSF